MKKLKQKHGKIHKCQRQQFGKSFLLLNHDDENDNHDDMTTLAVENVQNDVCATMLMEDDTNLNDDGQFPSETLDSTSSCRIHESIIATNLSEFHIADKELIDSATVPNDSSQCLMMISSDPQIDDPENNAATTATSFQTSQQLLISPKPSIRHRPDLFLLGVVVIVNGYTNPDVETIQRLLHKHGGDLERYETRRVTHIIAEHLSFAKAKMYKKQRKPLPVCYPSWIMDCVKEQRLLPYGDYIIDEMKDQNTTPLKSVASFFSHPKQPVKSNVELVPASKQSDDESSNVVFIDNNKQSGGSTTSADYVVVDDDKCQGEICNNAVNNHSDDSDVISTSMLPLTHNGMHRDRLIVSDEDSPCEEAAKSNMMNQSSVTSINQLDNDNVPDQPLDNETIAINDNTIVATSSVIKPKSTHINGRIRTVGTDPNFLESFFAASRLSFIGSYKQRGRQSPMKKKQQPTNDSSIPGSKFKRFVLHVDMDCFFAAVVLRNYPQYRNMPVAISHQGNKTKGAPSDYQKKDSSSECATCNYEARKFGVQKGMYLGRAKALCPNLIVLPYDFEGYEEVAEQVSDILYRHASVFNGYVEQVSCDESYMEFHVPDDDHDVLDKKSANEIISDVAEAIRAEIYETTQCTATVGAATNKLLAKLATDHVKPNRSYLLVNHRDLLRTFQLRDLNGIGYRLQRKLSEENLTSVQDVWDLGGDGEKELCRILGPAIGKRIFGFCQGEDSRPIEPAVRKTIGAECSYGVRFDGPYGVDHMVKELAKEVEKRMIVVGVKGSQVTLKLKQRKANAGPPPKFLGHGSCHNMSKSKSTPNSIATRDKDVIYEVAMSMLDEFQIPKDDIRGMGITMSKLCTDDSTTSETLPNGQATIQNWFSGPTVDRKYDSKRSEPSSPRMADHLCDGISDRMEIVLSDSDDDEMVIDADVDDDVVVLDPKPITTTPIRANYDIALPALSQIHMSQVKELPLEMQRQIQSQIRKTRMTREPANHGDENAQLNGTHANTFSRRSAHGVLTRNKSVHLTDLAATTSYVGQSDPREFFNNDVRPLNVFMDENQPITEDDDPVTTVINFLSLCIYEDRISDAIVLLRNIYNRSDACWSMIAFERIFLTVSTKVEDKFGYPLDREYL